MISAIVGFVIGVALFLITRKKPNLDADKGLSENQALVDAAISDLEKGINSIKTEQRDPSQVEKYYSDKDKKS